MTQPQATPGHRVRREQWNLHPHGAAEWAAQHEQAQQPSQPTP